jgi:hypothetical protein
MGKDHYRNPNDNGDGEGLVNPWASAKKLWEVDGDYFPLEGEDFLVLEGFRQAILGDKRLLRSMERQAKHGRLHPEVQRTLKLIASSQASNGQVDPEIQRILERLESFKARDRDRQSNPWAVGFFVISGFAVVLLGITIRQQERIARLERISAHPMMNFQLLPSANEQGR